MDDLIPISTSKATKASSKFDMDLIPLGSSKPSDSGFGEEDFEDDFDKLLSAKPKSKEKSLKSKSKSKSKSSSSKSKSKSSDSKKKSKSKSQSSKSTYEFADFPDTPSNRSKQDLDEELARALGVDPEELKTQPTTIETAPQKVKQDTEDVLLGLLDGPNTLANEKEVPKKTVDEPELRDKQPLHQLDDIFDLNENSSSTASKPSRRNKSSTENIDDIFGLSEKSDQTRDFSSKDSMDAIFGSAEKDAMSSLKAEKAEERPTEPTVPLSSEERTRDVPKMNTLTETAAAAKEDLKQKQDDFGLLEDDNDDDIDALLGLDSPPKSKTEATPAPVVEQEEHRIEGEENSYFASISSSTRPGRRRNRRAIKEEKSPTPLDSWLTDKPKKAEKTGLSWLDDDSDDDFPFLKKKQEKQETPKLKAEEAPAQEKQLATPSVESEVVPKEELPKNPLPNNELGTEKAPASGERRGRNKNSSTSESSALWLSEEKREKKDEVVLPQGDREPSKAPWLTEKDKPQTTVATDKEVSWLTSTPASQEAPPSKEFPVPKVKEVEEISTPAIKKQPASQKSSVGLRARQESIGEPITPLPAPAPALQVPPTPSAQTEALENMVAVAEYEKMKSKYEDQIREIQKEREKQQEVDAEEIKSLKATIDTLEKEVSSMTKEKSALEEKIDQSAEETESLLNQRTKELQSQHEKELTAKATAHAEALASLRKLHTTELESVRKLNEENESMQMILGEIRTTATSIKSIQNQAAVESIETQSKRKYEEELRERIFQKMEGSCKAYVNRVEDECARLQTLLATMESTMRLMKNQTSEERMRLKHEHDRLEDLAAELQAENAATRERLALEREALDKIRINYQGEKEMAEKRYNKRCEDLASERRAFESDRLAFSRHEKEAQAQEAILQGRLRQSEQRLQIEKDKLKVEQEAFHKKVASYAEDFRQLESQRQDLHDQIRSLEYEKQKVTEMAVQVQQISADLVERENTLRKEKAAAAIAVEEAQNLKLKVSNNRTRMEAQKQELVEEQKKMENLRLMLAKDRSMLLKAKQTQQSDRIKVRSNQSRRVDIAYTLEMQKKLKAELFNIDEIKQRSNQEELDPATPLSTRYISRDPSGLSSSFRTELENWWSSGRFDNRNIPHMMPEMPSPDERPRASPHYATSVPKSRSLPYPRPPSKQPASTGKHQVFRL